VRRLAIGLVLAVLPLAFAGQASGSAFYNQTGSDGPNPAKVYFSCGTFCNNNFSIPSGGGASRPGKAGSFYLTNQGGFTGQGQEACQLNSESVQDHGWGVIQYQSGTYEWAVYGNDQDAVSGSPFPVKFGIWNIDPERGPVGCLSG
jgi:hypothetical protein